MATITSFSPLRAACLILALVAPPHHVAARGMAWSVSSHVSEAGEPKEAFLLRVAGHLSGWTEATGFEACGVLATDGQRWAVRLITLRSQVQCALSRNMVPDGFSATDESIHSHPTPGPGGRIRLSQATRDAAARLGTASLRKARWFKMANDGLFSDEDYAAGPGYLVASGKLYYQGGRNQSREVGPVLISR